MAFILYHLILTGSWILVWSILPSFGSRVKNCAWEGALIIGVLSVRIIALCINIYIWGESNSTISWPYSMLNWAKKILVLFVQFSPWNMSKDLDLYINTTQSLIQTIQALIYLLVVLLGSNASYTYQKVKIFTALPEGEYLSIEDLEMHCRVSLNEFQLSADSLSSKCREYARVVWNCWFESVWATRHHLTRSTMVLLRPSYTSTTGGDDTKDTTLCATIRIIDRQIGDMIFA